MKCLLDIIWESVGKLEDAAEAVDDGYPNVGKAAISDVLKALAAWRMSLNTSLQEPLELDKISEMKLALTGKTIDISYE